MHDHTAALKYWKQKLLLKSAEKQAGRAALLGEPSVFYCMRSVDEGVGDGPVEAHSFERRPSAAVGDVVLGYGPSASAYHDQVRPVSFADVAASVYAEQVGRRVGHHPDNLLYGEAAAVSELEHHHQRVLYGRQTGGGVQVVLHFFGVQVGCVIGGDSLYPAIADCCGDGLPVCSGLYGGVALDPGTAAVIVSLVEPHVVYAYFGAYAWVCLTGLRYHVQLV